MLIMPQRPRLARPSFDIMTILAVTNYSSASNENTFTQSITPDANADLILVTAGAGDTTDPALSGAPSATLDGNAMTLLDHDQTDGASDAVFTAVFAGVPLSTSAQDVVVTSPTGFTSGGTRGGLTIYEIQFAAGYSSYNWTGVTGNVADAAGTITDTSLTNVHQALCFAVRCHSQAINGFSVPGSQDLDTEDQTWQRGAAARAGVHAHGDKTDFGTVTISTADTGSGTNDTTSYVYGILEGA